ncbi:uncharacterized protein [Macrobrachium rosenbergii]|uniref:uncharacterized protein n=1 Tax=Macrobrachium rosenbergii TaxID=79674 RepID=UPI0034D3EFA4
MMLAMRSVFPPSGEDLRRPPDLTTCLTAANGSLILSYGTKLLLISILGWRYNWKFIIADIRTPLLEADFLAHFSLAVDVGCKRLLNTQTYQSLPLSPGPREPAICSISPHQYGSLLKEFPEVLKPELRQMPMTPAKHGTYHYIKTKGPPTHAKFRQLPPQCLQEAKKAFAEMEEMGICKKAPSPWASPLHMVQKADGTWRPCVDYRRLTWQQNRTTTPCPNMQDPTASFQEPGYSPKWTY